MIWREACLEEMMCTIQTGSDIRLEKLPVCGAGLWSHHWGSVCVHAGVYVTGRNKRVNWGNMLLLCSELEASGQHCSITTRESGLKSSGSPGAEASCYCCLTQNTLNLNPNNCWVSKCVCSPSKSQDLSPIKKLWAEITLHQHHQRTREELLE